MRRAPQWLHGGRPPGSPVAVHDGHTSACRWSPRTREGMLLEPQSTALFILLMIVFCALLAWVALAKQPVFRVLAASLAFIPAMLFAVAAVNQYYDYYQTWGAVAADLTGQGLSTASSLPSGVSAQRLTAILGEVTDSEVAAQ